MGRVIVRAICNEIEIGNTEVADAVPAEMIHVSIDKVHGDVSIEII